MQHHLPRNLERIVRRSLRKNGKWLVASTILTLLIAWNWQLVLATGIGIGSMIFVYWLLLGNWQPYWSRCQGFVQSYQGKFSLAVGSGVFAAINTYIATTIYSEAENRWLAIGNIFQGLMSLLTFLLLAWFFVSRGNQQNESEFERLLAGLSSEHDLKRLIAVRQLTHFAQHHQFSAHYQEQLNEYFRIMLVRETEPTIQEALLDSLQHFDAIPADYAAPSESGPEPLQMSVELEPMPEPVSIQL